MEPEELDNDTLPVDVLMDMAEIAEDDIVAAQEWWNDTASEAWKGAIDDQE